MNKRGLPPQSSMPGQTFGRVFQSLQCPLPAEAQNSLSVRAKDASREAIVSSRAQMMARSCGATLSCESASLRSSGRERRWAASVSCFEVAAGPFLPYSHSHFEGLIEAIKCHIEADQDDANDFDVASLLECRLPDGTAVVVNSMTAAVTTAHTTHLVLSHHLRNRNDSLAQLREQVRQTLFLAVKVNHELLVGFM